MYKSRAEMKALAKDAFLSRYWLCVIVLLLYSLIIGAGSYTGIVAILLAGPLEVGLCAFSIRLQQGAEVNVATMFLSAFDLGFGRKLGGYWWRQLFTFLWSMLFVIPGIVKSLSYAMQSYILADCPDVTAKDSLKLSMRMMQGQKMRLFVLGLSFIGWALLSGITGGILALLYVGPYLQQTMAQFYHEVTVEAVATGRIRVEELYPAPHMDNY